MRKDAVTDDPMVLPDRSLPGLAEALDPEAVARFLRAAWAADLEGRGVRLDRVEIGYVRYKPGASLRIACRALLTEADGGSGTQILFGKLLPPARAHDAAARLACRKWIAPLCGPGAFALPEIPLVIWAFPNDRSLPGLRSLWEARRVKRLLRDLLPAFPRSDWRIKRSSLSPEVVVYKPERRCLVRLTPHFRHRARQEGVRVPLYARAYAGEIGRESHRLLTALWDSEMRRRSELLVPQPLGYDPVRRVLLEAAIEGHHILESRPAGGEAADAIRCARALAAFHRSGLDPRRLETPDQELRDLDRCARALARLASSLEGPALALGEALREGSAAIADPTRCPCHGDFYWKQVLVQEEQVALLDFDEVRWGDPWGDVGNFLAHLVLLQERGALAREIAQGVAVAFVEEYVLAVGGRVARDRLQWHLAAGLLRLAGEPFRALERGWQERCVHLLQEGLRVLGKDIREGHPRRIAPERRGMVAILAPSEDAGGPTDERARSRADEAIRREWGPEWRCLAAETLPAWPASGGGYARTYLLRTRAPDGGEHLWAGHEWSGTPWGDGREGDSSELCLFPRDPGLPHVADLLGGEGVADLLGREPLPGGGDANCRALRVEVLSYRPRKRCTLRYVWGEGGGGAEDAAVIGKVLRSGEAVVRMERALRWAREALAGPGAGSGVRVPGVLRVEPRWCFLVEAEEKGTSLWGLRGHAAFPEVCGRVGRALGLLHSQRAREGKAHSWQDEEAMLGRWVDLLREPFPREAQGGSLLLRELSGLARSGAPGPAVPIHRDLHDKQILSRGAEIVVLDWDSLARGEAALDVGNFLAHLTLRSLQDPPHAAACREGARHLLAGYSSAIPAPDLDPERLALYQGAALLRLALVYLLRPRWSALHAPLLAVARMSLPARRPGDAMEVVL